MTTQLPIDHMPLDPFCVVAEAVVIRSSPYQRALKPVIDRLGALLLLVVLLPLVGITALVVLLTLGRPVLFEQRRVGQGGWTFGMYKFRTMHPDRRRGDERRSRPRDSQGRDRRVTHKSPDDPRHTGVGLLLRRFSLDELPQLWNVVRGHMSLVGPRPELERVVAGYAEWQHQRHLVKPGVTGLWQVTERSGGDGVMHLHVDLDIDYIRRVSLRTDLAILMRTLPAALGRGG